MAIQKYNTAPGRKTATSSGPPKGLIEKEMMKGGKMMKAPKKKGKKKCSSK